MKCCGVENEKDFNSIASKWQQNINGQKQVHPVGCCQLKDGSSYSYDSNTQCNNYNQNIKFIKMPLLYFSNIRYNQ